MPHLRLHPSHRDPTSPSLPPPLRYHLSHCVPTIETPQLTLGSRRREAASCPIRVLSPDIAVDTPLISAHLPLCRDVAPGAILLLTQLLYLEQRHRRLGVASRTVTSSKND